MAANVAVIREAVRRDAEVVEHLPEELAAYVHANAHLVVNVDSILLRNHKVGEGLGDVVQLRHPSKVELGVVEAVVLGAVVDVGYLANLKAPLLAVVEVAQQLVPPPEHQRQRLPVAQSHVHATLRRQAHSKLVRQGFHKLRQALQGSVWVRYLAQGSLKRRGLSRRRLGNRRVVDVTVRRKDALECRLHSVKLRDGRRAVVQELDGSGVLAHEADVDWCQFALQVEEALRKGCGRHLHAALVARVDLEVMAVRAVQAQQASALAWVNIPAEPPAKRLGLLEPRVRELSAPLENEKGLGDHLRLAVTVILARRPPARLQLHLTVDAAEVPALLKDSPHLQQAAAALFGVG
eukprot:Opistho-1_new@88060